MHMTQKYFAVAPHRLTQHAHDTSHVDAAGFVRTSRRTTRPGDGAHRSGSPSQPEQRHQDTLWVVLSCSGESGRWSE